MVTNLAEQLRQGTTKSHSMAENVSFVKSFLSGVVDKKSYRTLVANLFFVYSAIEEEMYKNKDSISVSPIYFDQLNRKKSLEKDLLYYYGPDWKSIVKPSTITQMYVDRIHEIGNHQPELLISHAYTRYMGDLSGGQILKNIAKNAMQLSGDEGTEFYVFRDIKNDKEFKQMYRKALDSISVTEDQVNLIISEANVAFNLNMKMFQELNSNIVKIMLMLLSNTINNFRNRI
uniref:heme oxygenase n=1 Tax=Lithothamnion corallioides TaxID=1277934 RepID=UPI0023F4727E|nr:heme oxygenase [Lithothamnion corallioides]WEA77000.1 heme oxygenase [Lithothamnion corallioides]